MNNKILKSVEISALALSIITTVLAMLYSAGWSIDFGAVLFILWAISPYICVFSIGQLLKKITSIPQTSLLFCTVAILMFVFTLLTYSTMFANQSSTAALAFVIVPFYLFIGSFILLGIGLLFAFFFKRSAKKQV